MNDCCKECNELADGLDGEHCQVHWEKLCAESWWILIDSVSDFCAP
jgi:hypothetical protein